VARAAGTGVRIEVLTTRRGTVWHRCGKGPALLLLHGGAGSWLHWTRNIDALSAAFTLWIPDLPGLGASAMVPEPRDHGAVAKVLAADLDELLPQGEVGDIAGFSFGGIVAGFLAGERRSRFRTLVIVGAGGLGLRDKGERLLKPWKHLASEAERIEVHRYNFAALMVSREERIDDEALRLYTENVLRARINSARSSRSDALKLKIAELGMPAHGIWGGLDVTAHGKFDEIRAILRTGHPGAELSVIEDAGHWVQYEKAEAFNATLLRLLGKK
jgi:2-hydroxy-6-oxonona-2,4-dienedioate hydrolase